MIPTQNLVSQFCFLLNFSYNSTLIGPWKFQVEIIANVICASLFHFVPDFYSIMMI